MMRRANPLRGAVTGAMALALLTACSGGDGPDFEASPAPDVDLSVGLPEGLKIGVIRSSSEGGDLLGPGAGARLAEYRLDGLGRTPDAVTLVVENDKGTSDGAVEAVDALAEAEVSGIVYLSSGPYMAASLERADELGVPVLAPYEVDDELAAGRDGVWLTGPSARASVSSILELTQERGLDLRVVQVGGDYAADALAPVTSDIIPIDSGLDARQIDLALAAELQADAEQPDAVLVWGTSEEAASVVGALQRLDRQRVLPVYLSSDATRPSFGQTLADLQVQDEAVVEGLLFAPSIATTDLDPSPAAQGFFAALRLAASDEGQKSLDEVSAFSEVAAEADVRSHDAVLLLANAARVADSLDPAEVAAALLDLTADEVGGLVGPLPDFKRSSALTGDHLVLVQADPLGSDVRSALPLPDDGASDGVFRMGWTLVDVEGT